MLQNKSNKHFRAAFFLYLLAAVLLSILLIIKGKYGSFLFINGGNSSAADFFFKYATHAGDGLVWVLPGLYCIFFNRKYLIAIIAGIIISTVLTHLFKRIVFPEELRPVTFLSDTFPVHIVEGVKMNRMNSFPSGHTATAFTLALLISFITDKKALACLLPLLAFVVGYSRVYLAQHFVTDVLGGICIGIISALLSIMLYLKFMTRKL